MGACAPDGSDPDGCAVAVEGPLITAVRSVPGMDVAAAASTTGVVHAWVGQIVTFFAYRPPSRPLGSLTPTQPGRVTNPTQGHPEPPWEAPQAECWLLRREPKPPA